MDHQVQNDSLTVSRVSAICVNHPAVESVFFCNGCESDLCEDCPAAFGAVRVCLCCGSLCRSANETAGGGERPSRAANFEREPFGLIDLRRALAHPLKFRNSLFLGCFIFVVLGIGQFAAGIGGPVPVFASILCAILAGLLIFGFFSNTIANFSLGRFDSNFMPRFGDLSLWNNLIHPLFMGVGAILSSFGPFILVCLASIYLIANAADDQERIYSEQLAKVPGTEYYAPNRTAEQSQEVRELLEPIRKKIVVRVNEKQSPAPSAGTVGIAPETVDEGRTYMAERARSEPKPEDPIQNQNGAMPSGSQTFESNLGDNRRSIAPANTTTVLSGILKLAAPLFVIGVITFIWALFYFPAACAVAGNSRSFAATVNPVVGLDSIKKLGLDYAKLVLYSVAILGACTLVRLLSGMIFAPISMFRIGELLSTIVTSALVFYLTIVFAYLIGCILAKSVNPAKQIR